MQINSSLQELKDWRKAVKKDNECFATAWSAATKFEEHPDEQVRIKAKRLACKILFEDTFHFMHYCYYDVFDSKEYNPTVQRNLIGRFASQEATQAHERWLESINNFAYPKRDQFLTNCLFGNLKSQVAIALGIKKAEQLWVSTVQSALYSADAAFSRRNPRQPFKSFYFYLEKAFQILASMGNRVDRAQDHSAKITALAHYLRKRSYELKVLYLVVPLQYWTLGRTLSDSEKVAVIAGVKSLDPDGISTKKSFDTLVRYGNGDSLEALNLLIQCGADPRHAIDELALRLDKGRLVFDPNRWDLPPKQVSDEGSFEYGSFTGGLVAEYPRIVAWKYSLQMCSETTQRGFFDKVSDAFTHFSSQDITELAKDAPQLGGEQFGRTLLSCDFVAHKFLKTDEKLTAFFWEAAVCSAFHTLPEGKKPWSTLPWAHQIHSVSSTPEQKSSHTLKSCTPPGYFTYINDSSVSDRDFSKGMRAFLRDGAWMISHGMLPQSIALYHNESTQRGYLPLLGWLCSELWNAGRLDDIEGAVRYPNVGLTGIRDVGDFLFEDDVIKNPRLKSVDLKFCDEETIGAKRFLLRSNALAELALTQFLLIQSRLLACSRLANTHPNFVQLNWQDPVQIEKVALWGIEGMAAIHVGYMEESRDMVEAAEQAAKTSKMHWQRWAKQLIFWIQTGKGGYVEHLERDKCPPFHELYGFTPVPGKYIDWTAVDNWLPARGMMSNKKSLDLGGFNRSFPCKEEEKRWHLLIDIVESGLKQKGSAER